MDCFIWIINVDSSHMSGEYAVGSLAGLVTVFNGHLGGDFSRVADWQKTGFQLVVRLTVVHSYYWRSSMNSMACTHELARVRLVVISRDVLFRRTSQLVCGM